MEEIIIAFGRAVRKYRKERGLTQEELGFESDIQRIYVSKLELGQQQPSLTTICKLAIGLNCSASELLQRMEAEIAQSKSK